MPESRAFPDFAPSVCPRWIFYLKFSIGYTTRKKKSTRQQHCKAMSVSATGTYVWPGSTQSLKSDTSSATTRLQTVLRSSSTTSSTKTGSSTKSSSAWKFTPSSSLTSVSSGVYSKVSKTTSSKTGTSGSSVYAWPGSSSGSGTNTSKVVNAYSSSTQLSSQSNINSLKTSTICIPCNQSR